MEILKRGVGGPGQLVFPILLWLLCTPAHAADPELVSPITNHCTPSNVSVPGVCDLKGKDAILLGTRWNNVKGLAIKNASSLQIEPQCNASDKELKIYDSRNVGFRSNEEEPKCLVQLRLTNCTAGTIAHLFNRIYTDESIVETIHLDVEQFDILEKSEVGELDIKARHKKSQILNSRVDVISRMEIEGDFKFEVSESSIGELHTFVYNSGFSMGSISSTKVDKITGFQMIKGNLEWRDSSIASVSKRGFQIIEGTLTVENVTFNHLELEAIIVEGGNLYMKNVSMAEVDDEVILMSGISNIGFENCMINGKTQVSFKLESAGNATLWPLKILLPDNSLWLLYKGLIIGLLIGLIIGAILIIVLRYYNCCPSLFTKLEGKEKMQFPSAIITTTPKHEEPQPPTPLIDHSLKNKKEEEEEFYEEYLDVENVCVSPQNRVQGTVIPPAHSNFTSDSSAFMPNSINLPSSAPPPLPASPSPQVEQCQEDDDSEPIYDECENYESSNPITPPPLDNPLPPPTKPDNKLNMPTNAHTPRPIIVKNKPLPGLGEHHGSQPNVHLQQQTPVLPRPPNTKPSFLHNSGKPPPPPRIRNDAVPGTPVKPPPAAKIKPSGLKVWPPPSTPDQSQFSGSVGDEEEEDIYEIVPDY